MSLKVTRSPEERREVAVNRKRKSQSAKSDWDCDGRMGRGDQFRTPIPKAVSSLEL